ncbi:ATP-binding protein [Singulisphaera acidiphila]|uniref:histidine kinase n=1 Tax=Singulisphaera acidiphila (strain ATCC BAA-1392 / DSM 18658 / VKM B-2454 / MOB10) TaxID=886293 RepID=L0DFS3_SINAD|nr:ATP-binding protein [Singulisphaera acidiphila]AGA27705.1 PAS domain S-box [Singulisphaera acidiphila DSM 18658]
MRNQMDPRQQTGWRQFIDGLPVDSRLGQVFLESWRGVQVEVEEDVCGSDKPPGKPLLDSADLHERLDKNRAFLEAARPIIAWADRALGHIAHLVYLIDHEGIVLHAVGNDPSKMAKLGLLPGSDWSEASKGRNGAGTALAEDRPVAVVGPDHLTHPLDDCTWTGAPLHTPDGPLIGAIGLTTCAEDGTPDRLILTAYLAQLIEQDLASKYAKPSQCLPLSAAVVAESEILEVIAGPFCLLDEQWRFVALNREAERLLGRTREELMGQLACDVFSEVVGSIFDRKFQEVKETGQAVDFELFFPERDAWHAAHVQPSRFGLIVHTHDITARKRTEEELRASEEQLRLISDLTAGFTYTVGIGLDGSLTAEAVSPGYFRILGTTLEEMNARGWADFVHADDRALVLESHRRLVAGQSEVQEIRNVTQDGTVRWIRYSSRPIWDETHERVVRFVGAGQDVTERRLAEDALKEAERRKDEFLAMLAHELRNPLAPLRNALHTLKPEVAGTAIEPVQAMMERQVDRLARLLDDLLDVSRITRGKIELRKEVVDLTEPVQRAVESLTSHWEQGGPVLTVTMPDGPLLVEGDAVRLEQVFDNLLDNANKYTKPGGTIHVEVGREAGLATVRVSDTGIGIAAEMLPHVFDLFNQAERILVQSQGGLGIGLNLVRRLVEMHGGGVTASSAGPGLGSEFLVRIPALPESFHPPAAKSRATPGPRLRRRILVVDDNTDSARSMASLLSRLWNQDVAVAYDAASALVLADSFHPDVVLLDIGLPGPSGYELARRLRERPGFRTTLLVAMSGWGREEDRRKSREAGIDHHLVKPIAPNDLEILLANSESTAAG